jgi:hypothetical protein
VTSKGIDRRSLRVDIELWDEFGAAIMPASRSSVLREFIRWYLGKPGAVLPRPATAVDE